MENRDTKLVQISDKVELGLTNKFIGANTDTIIFVDEANNPTNVQTGNLHVKGNLIIDTGHVTEFDVGTAIFADKKIELGASQEIVANMANGTGILAVNGFSPTPGVTVSGISTSEVVFTIPQGVWISTRRLTIATADNTLNFDITSASSSKDVNIILNKNAVFKSLFISSYTDTTLTIQPQNSATFTNAEIDSFVGPSITYNSLEEGWSFNERLSLSTTGINNLLDTTKPFTPFTIQTKDNTVKVSNNYESWITSDNDLVNKKWIDLHCGVDAPTIGFKYPGVDFVDGFIEIDMEQAGGSGLHLSDDWTTVLPWVNLDFGDTTANPVTLLAAFDKANPNSYGMELQHSSNTLIFNYYGSTVQTLTFNTPFNNKLWIRPIVVYSGGNLTIYISNLSLGTQPILLEDRNYDSITIGGGLSATKYTGNMTGELMIFNYGFLPADINKKEVCGIWAPYGEQWGLFEDIVSGPLTIGKYYEIEYVTGDFTNCGMLNESGTQICRITATPTWGDSNAYLNGCCFYWVLNRRLSPTVDVLELAKGVNGMFNGLLYYNDPTPDPINLQSYI